VRVLFTSSIPYLPQIYGGLNTNTHQLFEEFLKRGHAPALLTRLSYGNRFGIQTAVANRLRGREVSCDNDFGYPVFRAREPWKVVEAVPRADVAVMQDGHMLQFSSALARRGVPMISYFHGLDFEDWTIEGRPAAASDLPEITYLANSMFTAKRFERRYKLQAKVIPPVFRPDLYRTERAGKNVVFINPVPEKGVELAIEIAAGCPEIPFVFVKGWPLSLAGHWRLRKKIRRLSNVKIVERCKDMRKIYRDCHILLVPSKWIRETWGRVASEAHFSGIPVIGSNVGGLPEAIGPGGIVIDRDQPAEAWIEALKRLWRDEKLYSAKSQAARVHSQRAQLDVSCQVDALEAAFGEALAMNEPQVRSTRLRIRYRREGGQS
jgi:glycosyltransferase involved in cell wall biosynthesis